MKKLLILLLISKMLLATTAYVTSVTSGSQVNNFTGYVGFQFTVGGADIPVTQLAWYCWPGDSSTHEVWVDASTHGTADCGTVTPPNWAFTSTVSVTLTASSTHTLLGHVVNGGGSWGNDTSTTITTTAVATVAQSFFCADGGSPVSGCSGNSGGHVYGPPGFKYGGGNLWTAVAPGGNWATGSVWDQGSAPDCGNQFAIGVDTTVTVTTSVCFGTSGAAGTVDGTISGTSGHLGSLVIAGGTVDAKGDTLIQQYGSLDLQNSADWQFDSPSGVAYKISSPLANNGLPYPVLKSTATSWNTPARVRTKPGNVGVNGSIFQNCCDSSFDFNYLRVDNLGTSSVPGVKAGGDLKINEMLMFNSGQLTHVGASFAFQACIHHLTAISSLSGQPINVTGPLSPTTCDTMTDSVVVGTGAGQSVNLQWNNMAFQNVLFGIGTIFMPATDNVSWDGVLSASPYADDNAVEPAYQSRWTWKNGAIWMGPGTGNFHGISDVNAGSVNKPNGVWRLSINGNGGVAGDLWVQPGVHYVSNTTLGNGSGNTDDGTGGATDFGYINHITSENSAGGGANAVLALDEFSFGNQLKQGTNILSDREYTILCPAQNSATYTAQGTLNYDWNWISNRKDPDPDYFSAVRPWNATTSHQGSLCDAWLPFTKGNVTVTTVTDATHLIISSTTSPLVSAGDYLFHTADGRGAFVIAVTSSQHVTIGKDQDGVDGIPAAVAGQSLAVLPNFWTSGVFGASGKGQHEGYADPKLRNPTVSVAQWDGLLGGPGTDVHARTMMFQMTGWDSSGNRVTPDARYTLANWIAFQRWSLTPTNPALLNQGLDIQCATSTAYAVGASCGDPAKHLQICITAGTTAGFAPTWNDNGGNTTHGAAVFEDQGRITVPGAMPVTTFSSTGENIGGGVY